LFDEVTSIMLALTSHLLALDFSDPQVWIYVIVTVLGIGSAIFQSGKKTPPKELPRQTPTAPPRRDLPRRPDGVARPLPPGNMPRPAQRVEMPRRPEAPPRPEPRRAGRTEARRPPSRQPDWPKQRRQTPDQTPIAMPHPAHRDQPREREAAARVAQAVEAVAAGAASHRVRTEPAAVVARPPTEETRRVRVASRNRAELRAAFVLSEVLAPPVALRDNHPF
jgi:hypothetical protein